MSKRKPPVVQLETREIDGHRWTRRSPPRAQDRHCDVSLGVVLQLGQPRFTCCRRAAKHTHPYVGTCSRWSMPLCAKHAAEFKAAGKVVLEGEWWPDSLTIKPAETAVPTVPEPLARP